MKVGMYSGRQTVTVLVLEYSYTMILTRLSEIRALLVLVYSYTVDLTRLSSDSSRACSMVLTQLSSDSSRAGSSI